MYNLIFDFLFHSLLIIFHFITNFMTFINFSSFPLILILFLFYFCMRYPSRQEIIHDFLFPWEIIYRIWKTKVELRLTIKKKWKTELYIIGEFLEIRGNTFPEEGRASRRYIKHRFGKESPHEPHHPDFFERGCTTHLPGII